MELDEYERMYRLEGDYWWYVGMRAIQAEFLAQLPKNGRILDAGCGTGANLVFLADWGRALGVDLSLEGLRFCRRRGLSSLSQASVIDLPIRPASLDLVTSFDVLFHRSIEEDGKALSEMHRVLKNDGALLLRVPAHNWLRGAHDRAVHTRRRYGRRELKTKLEAAGFEVQRLTYVNAFLFPAIALKRAAQALRRSGSDSDLAAVPGPLNRFLLRALKGEAWMVRRGWRLPVGLSLMALARKR